MSMNMTMKKVAGFHSFDLGFLVFVAEGEEFRRGLGTKFFQNEVDATLCTVANARELLLEGKARAPSRDVLKLGGARRSRRNVAALFMVD
jgi:hypothetical protein